MCSRAPRRRDAARAPPPGSSVRVRAASLRPRSATYSSSSSTDEWCRPRCSACTKNGQMRSLTMRPRSGYGDLILRTASARWSHHISATSSSVASLSSSHASRSVSDPRVLQDHVDVIGFDPGIARPLPAIPVALGPAHVGAIDRREFRERAEYCRRDLHHHPFTVAFLRRMFRRDERHLPDRKTGVERSERDRDVDAVVVGEGTEIELLEQ